MLLICNFFFLSIVTGAAANPPIEHDRAIEGELRVCWKVGSERMECNIGNSWCSLKKK